MSARLTTPYEPENNMFPDWKSQISLVASFHSVKEQHHYWKKLNDAGAILIPLVPKTNGERLMTGSCIACDNLRRTLDVALIPATLSSDGPEIPVCGRIGDEGISLDARVADIPLEVNPAY